MSISVVLTKRIREGEELKLFYPLAERGACRTCAREISMVCMRELPALNISQEARDALTSSSYIKRSTRIQSRRTTSFFDHDKV